MGSGVLPLAMATRPARPPVQSMYRANICRQLLGAPAGEESEYATKRVFKNRIAALAVTWIFLLILAAECGTQTRHRAISTGQLHGLPRFHLRPINVVVYHGSQRDLVLRRVSRLDAFSGYLIRT